MGFIMAKLKHIVFTKLNTAELLSEDNVNFDTIPDDYVVVKSHFTTVSAGTERANLTGSGNVGPNGASATFPKKLGYNCAGVVVKIGSKVKKVAVGDRVVVYWSTHSNYNIAQEDLVVKIEDDNISYQEAAISFIATFPLAAIRKTKLEIGEPLMVMGLGILGQIAVKLAKIAGACPIIACDPVLARRDEALRYGADYVFNPLDKDFAKQVKTVTGGVKVAIEVTGVGAGLNETLDCMAKFGRVALLGCTRNSDFTIDYYQKVHVPGISLIGAHTCARAEKESTHANYTHIDDIKTVLKLCSLNRLNLIDIIKETHLPDDCTEVYNRLAFDKNFPVGVQFDWSKEF